MAEVHAQRLGQGGAHAPATGDTARWRRRFLAPWAAGLVGVASLLLVAPPPSALDALPPAASWPPLALRALLALNPLLLVTLCAAVGAALAHRVGVTSVLAGTQPFRRAAVVASLARAAALGLAAGLAFAGVDGMLLPLVDPQAAHALRVASADAPGPAAAVLYGALAEEVIARWGLMSALAWAMAWVLARVRAERAPRVTRGVAVAAVVIAALAFAVAHLPALAALVDLTPGLLARTLGLNIVAGVVCGVLAFRQGLEAAMAAHAAMHLGTMAGAALLV